MGKGFQLILNWKLKTEIQDIAFYYSSGSAIENFFHIFESTILCSHINQSYNIDEYKSFLISKINAGFPIILGVYTRFLDYYIKVPSQFRYHYITMFGYDEEKAIISDCLVPGVKDYDTYVGKISFESLYSANKENEFIYYDFNPEIIVNKLYTNRHCLVNMSNSSFFEALKGFNEIEIDKYKILANRIGNICEMYSEEEIKSVAEDFFFNIKYNGIIYSREMIMNYYNEYFQGKYSKDIEVVNSLKSIVKSWDNINYLLFRNNLSTCSSKKYKEIESRLNELIEIEIRTYEMILNNSIS